MTPVGAFRPTARKSDAPLSLRRDNASQVDLCARIREILQNYPEGPSILKELLQNAVSTVFPARPSRPCCNLFVYEAPNRSLHATHHMSDALCFSL